MIVLNVAYPLAQVTPGTAGGAEQILLALDKGLVARGHQSIVLAAIGSRCSGLLVPVRVPVGELDEAAKADARLLFKAALDSTIERFSIDVVHMHGLDFHEYLPPPSLPTIVTLHLPLSWYGPSALNRATQGISYVCVSRTQAGTAPRGLCISRVIPNGIDLHDFRPTKKVSHYALVMSRICPEKGIHLAVEAANRTSTRLLIAGEVFDYPEHREYFEEEVRPLLTSNVQFLGKVGGRHKAQLLAGAKCLLIPSLAPETSSLVAMEAMACGTPVIAWRSGALPEIVDDGQTGFLISSVEEMADAIARIDVISRNQCRRIAEERFSQQTMISKYLCLYSELTRVGSQLESQAA